MGTIQIQTPVLVQVKDYHDFRSILDAWNLSPHLIETVTEGRKPEATLHVTPKALDGDYFYNGYYHGIIYLPGIDDEAAAKMAAEIEATLAPDY